MHMKIEKISENQIKCTLNQSDLASRQLMLAEFAYGTDKAKEFFRDMMMQASDEVGFEADNIPLMIEAVPVSTDCLVLIITKVEDPEELDTRFSRFSRPTNLEEYNEDDEDDEDEDSYEIPIQDMTDSSLKEDEEEFIPLPETVRSLQGKKEEKKEKAIDVSRVYQFQSLDDVCALSVMLKNQYHGDNTLYKDTMKDEYYLIMSKANHSPEEFQKVCNLVSEYGVKHRYSYAFEAYCEEHFLCVIRSNAISTLMNL